ncbi:MAG: response regulator [Phycisphaerales bacterium]
MSPFDPGSNSTPTVLVVDNDEAMSTALRTRIESAGYRVLEAHGGQEALEMFEHQNVDAVVTDLAMPAGNGIQLARHLREISYVPIIVLTGFQPEYRRELRHLQEVTVLRKPCSSSDLLDTLEQYLLLSGCTLP